jgi:serine protease AprX
VLARAAELTQPVMTLVRRAVSGWTPAAGLCPACAGDYAARFQARRSPASLHTTTDPHTTFPYYHPAEETVLGQPERLPDYATFTGAGVTLAFLDSGYYPHPDLARDARWPGESPTWIRLTPEQLRAALEPVGTRLVDYADLTDGGERVGLDTPSLWDGAGDSWHGQMTTAVAAGNGLLSGGRYRGYAPEASILAIKIGRGGGRIPEEDILRGLQWLLEDERWRRYGVRIVNVSIGGDFPQAWQDNPVCRAAHALAQRGVFVAAAAGNRGADELLAPAQTPTVLTVGGVEDGNRMWRPVFPDETERLSLYHHNFGVVHYQNRLQRKPELLALGNWLPAPILPPSWVLREMHAIDRVRRVLLGADEHELELLLDHWGHALHEPASPSVDERVLEYARWMPEVWHGLRRRMNAHKWVHPYYQHVEGTSVAVAQVSAVAAQMLQANPHLNVDDLHRLLGETSLRLPHLLPLQTGAGLLQPALAVAAALRTSQGPLVGIPRSATPVSDSELRKLTQDGTLAVPTPQGGSSAGHVVYFGCFAPQARAVSLVGPFNQWRPGSLPLVPARAGWWHLAVELPTGAHSYRFWSEDDAHPRGEWRRDPENPNLAEGGYREAHSLIVI